MQCSLQSDVGVKSPAVHRSAGRHILFNLPGTLEELFHQARDDHSVLGRRRLKTRSLAMENVMP